MAQGSLYANTKMSRDTVSVAIKGCRHRILDPDDDNCDPVPVQGSGIRIRCEKCDENDDDRHRERGDRTFCLCDSSFRCPHCGSATFCVYRDLEGDIWDLNYAESPSYVCQVCTLYYFPCFRCGSFDGGTYTATLADVVRHYSSSHDGKASPPAGTISLNYRVDPVDGPDGGIGVECRCPSCATEFYLSDK